MRIHTPVTLLTSRDLTCSSGRFTRQHASHISVVVNISWGVTNVSSAEHWSRYENVTKWCREFSEGRTDVQDEHEV